MKLLLLVSFIFYISASNFPDSPPLHKKIIQLTKKLSKRSTVSGSTARENINNNNNSVSSSAIQPINIISSFPFYSMSPCGNFFLQQKTDFFSYILMDAQGKELHQPKLDYLTDCKFRPFDKDIIYALSTDSKGSIVKYTQQKDGSFQRTLLKKSLKIETTWYGETAFALQRDTEICDPVIQDQFTLFDVLKEETADTITIKRDMRFVAHPLIHNNAFLPLFLGYWAEKPHRIEVPIPYPNNTQRQHYLLAIVNEKCVSDISLDQAAQSYAYSEDHALVALLSNNKRLSLIEYTSPNHPLIKKYEDDISQIINEDDASVFFIGGRICILTFSNSEHQKTSLFVLIGRTTPYKLTKIVELNGAYQLVKTSLGEYIFVQKPVSPNNFTRERTIYQLNEEYFHSFDNPQ